MAHVSAQLTTSKRTWPVSANFVLQNIVRYLLAIGMMPYALSKLANYQLQLPAWVYAQPLAEISGISLTWAFLGYQPWFQFLLGVLEIVPALLLLFRRTRRGGALLMLPVVLNVALMNYATDLWRDTKQIATVFLVMNVYLLACDWPLWRQMARQTFQRTAASRPLWKFAERAVPLVIVAGVCFLLFVQTSIERPLIDFVGDRQINRAGTWAIREVTLDGRLLPARGEAFLYFGVGKNCQYVVERRTSKCRYQADHGHHNFRIDDIALAPGSSSIHGSSRLEGTQMILDGSSPAIRVVLERYRWGRQLPFRALSAGKVQ